MNPLLVARLDAQLRRQRKEVQTLAKALRSRQRVGDVHDLRVATRRIRAACRILGRGKRLRRDLQKMGKALGERRQLDVTLRLAKKYRLDAARLCSTHRSSGRKLARFMGSKREKKVEHRLSKLVSELKNESDVRLDRVVRSAKKELEHWIRSAPKSKSQLHQFRISVKKLRYVFEMLDCPVGALKLLQAQLGRGHDLEVLRTSLKADRSDVKRDEEQAWRRAMQLRERSLRRALRQLNARHGDPS